MTRIQYDCSGSNARYLHSLFPDAEMIAWYGTGTVDIRWMTSDLDLWPNAIKTEIDQGYSGSPLATATVRDVERGAWKMADAVNRNGWTAERPTIYCSMSGLQDAVRFGWQGDVWLAAPGAVLDKLPKYPGINIVAIQDWYKGSYDSSTVYDDNWPYLSRKDADVIHFTLDSNEQRFVPVPEGTFKSVLIYAEYLTDGPTAEVRMEFHSKTEEWTTVVKDYERPNPFIQAFPHPDVDAISIHNMSRTDGIGFTIT